MTCWVLMYHRVCRRSPETAPWFDRGTAVTPETLARQLDWTAERFEVVSLEELLASPPRSARAALTFDDGYSDVLTAAEICSERGMPATCFAPAGPALDGAPLWFDLWYAIVAGGPLDEVRGRLRAQGCPDAAIPADWIAGPPRRWINESPHDARLDLLTDLAAAFDVRPPRYLTFDELTELAAAGWTIGGHGRKHLRLPECSESEVAGEISASLGLLMSLGVEPRVFAYPDGAYDGRVLSAVGRAGFRVACTVEGASLSRATDPLRVPRLFCRGDSIVPHPAMLREA